MSCGRFLNGAPGTNAQFKVTQDNGESLWGRLSDFDRASGQVTPTTFSGGSLRAGITFPLVAGHSYHFLIAKMPSSGQIGVQATVPKNSVINCVDTGRFIGPWIVRV